MRTVIPNVPDWVLEDRARKGHDVFDEMWEGVLHMIPPPSYQHQWLATALVVTLHARAQQLGLSVTQDTGLYRPGAEDSWRVPDIVFVRPEHASHRGVEGVADFLVELLSPGDETYAKLPFYAEMGVRELLIVEPESRRVELYANCSGSLEPVPPARDGAVRSAVLDRRFQAVTGPRLRISGPGVEPVEL